MCTMSLQQNQLRIRGLLFRGVHYLLLNARNVDKIVSKKQQKQRRRRQQREY